MTYFCNFLTFWNVKNDLYLPFGSLAKKMPGQFQCENCPDDCYASRTRGVVLCRDPWTPVIAGVVRGEISPAWVYVLRASLKTQSAPDFRNFEGFMPLAQRQLGR